MADPKEGWKTRSNIDPKTGRRFPGGEMRDVVIRENPPKMQRIRHV